jgi:DNA-directed RNA polymerase subunit RPC12/RpoP
MRDRLKLSSTSNFCTRCGKEVTGNVRPEEEVDIICGRCTAGQALYVANRPEDYPVPVWHGPKAKRATKTKWDKKMEGKTLSDC